MNANPVIDVAQLPTDAAAQLIAIMPVLATSALTQSSAINVITTLAAGTPQACQGVLAPLGVVVQGGVFDFQSQEWGMGYDSGTNRWLIVLGGPGATAYVGNGLNVCWNFIHSHPREATLTAFCNMTLAQLQNDLFDMGHGAVTARTLRAVLTWFVENGPAISLVQGIPTIFPSDGDINANYTLGWDGVGAVRTNRLPRDQQPNVSWPNGSGVEIMYPHCSLITQLGHANENWITTVAWTPGAGLTQLEVQYGPTVAQLIPNFAAGPETGVNLVHRFYCPVVWQAGHFTFRSVIEMDPHSPPHQPTARPLPGIPNGIVTRTRRQAAAITQNRA